MFKNVKHPQLPFNYHKHHAAELFMSFMSLNLHFQLVSSHPVHLVPHAALQLAGRQHPTGLSWPVWPQVGASPVPKRAVQHKSLPCFDFAGSLKPFHHAFTSKPWHWKSFKGGKCLGIGDRLPKINVCKVWGSCTFSRSWLKLSPKAKCCKELGQTNGGSKGWLKRLPNLKLRKLPGKLPTSWLKPSPKVRLCKLKGSWTCLRLWLKLAPKVKVCKSGGQEIREIGLSNFSPRVKCCSVSGKSAEAKFWSNKRPNVRLFRPCVGQTEVGHDLSSPKILEDSWKMKFAFSFGSKLS